MWPRVSRVKDMGNVGIQVLVRVLGGLESRVQRHARWQANHRRLYDKLQQGEG